MHKLEFAVASNQTQACHQLAAKLNGYLYVDNRGAKGLPFTTLLTVVTDNLQPLMDVADVGLYVICRRVIKPGAAKKIALFPMIHHPQKSHAECDGHWRDTHAPLALVHHEHMTEYNQLSVVHRINGAEIDGFALCGFETEEDIRERFYTTRESIGIIANDVRQFAHPEASPRRLIATPVHTPA